MLKALGIGTLVFIPFAVFVLLTYFFLMLPPIYRFLHARSSAAFVVISLACIVVTFLYLGTLNRVLVHRVETIAHLHFFVRWIAVTIIGGAAAFIVTAVFCAVAFLIALIFLSGKRWT